MKKIKKLAVGIGILVGVTVLSLILRTTPLFDQFEKKLTHGFYIEREATDVVIVGIDDRSFLDPVDGGLGAFYSWPKKYYASVVNNLREADAHSIFIDVVFPNVSQTISLSEIAEIVKSSENFSDVGEKTTAFLDESPSDKAFENSMGKDIFFYSYPSSTPELLENKLEIQSVYGTLDQFTQKANEVIGNVFPDGNEQAVYGLPVGYVLDGEFVEGLDLKIARDFLYRGKETSGHFSEDGKNYIFDEKRVIPVEDGQFLVNYASKSRGFPEISFASVYAGDFDPADVEGKIVMIGATATILQDLVTAPIDEDVAMPGVELRANGIETILDGAFLRHQSGIEFLMMVLVMVGAAVGVSLFLPVYFGAGVLVLEVILYPFFGRFIFTRGVIVDIIWPLLAVLAAYFAVLFYRNFAEFREKRQIKNAFSHYVSADLVKQIAANPEMLQLGGERKEITAMFLDLENFTSLSESLEPQKVVEIINTYFDAFAEVIMAHGGTVDKFEGDAIMALFGAPVAQEKHALNACLAALALRGKIKELNQATGQNLNLRIGIASGPAVVGNMGSKERFDYTAMGDTVNTASRLESGNKFYGTRILVNPEAMAAAQEKIAFRRIDTVRLKGKENAIGIFEILGARETLSEAGRKVVEEWHQALEYYRNQEWDEVEVRMKRVLESIPEDGPSKVYLQRVAGFRVNPPAGWDGTWRFEEK
ncbi:adenylate/guanylate cyclase domain-containing protein [Patescibacteria group bacterium]|nr:adenylate/guanylate cyclase domain-containing protein [Patescibacteria group bacterium]